MIPLPPVGFKPQTKPDKIRLFIYGAPYSGKTTFAASFNKVLLLSTDGNIASLRSDSSAFVFNSSAEITAPDGRTLMAWELLKEFIEALKTDTTYETVVLDLVDDFYNACRLYHLKKLGIEHESDKSLKAWSIIRDDFAQTMRSLTTLNKDIIFISHEDSSRDFTSRMGDKVTAFAPNIQLKVANKVASLVDISARLINVNNKPYLDFTSDSDTFGGSRYQFKNRTCPANYKALLDMINQCKNSQE